MADELEQTRTPTKRPQAFDALSPKEDKRPCLPSISESQRHQLELLGIGLRGNVHGEEHELATECRICSRQKHEVSWQYRVVGTNGNLRRTVVGSACSCCVRACCKLRITRSVELLEKVPGVLDKVRETSRLLSTSAKGGNRCICSQCGGTVQPKKAAACN